MKKLVTIIIIMTTVINGIQAQKAIDLKHEIRKVDCDAQKVVIDLYIRSSYDDAFLLGSTSLRMTFNDEAIINPVIAEGSPVGGMYETNVQNDVFSYGLIIFEEANAPELEVEWLRIGTVMFDVVSVFQPMDLRWKDGDEYPASTAQEFVSFLEQPDINIENTYDYIGDLSSWCAVSTDIEETPEEEFNTDINIFPNPSNGMIYLQMNTTSSSPGDFEITGIDGKRILNGLVDTENEGVVSSIDLTNVSAGTYFITVLDGQRKTTKQIEIIQD